MSQFTTSQHYAGVEGARPYGAPPGSVPAAGEIRAHARGAVPYVSDTAFVGDTYADRPICRGTRTDGQPCGAKAAVGKECCKRHEDQE